MTSYRFLVGSYAEPHQDGLLQCTVDFDRQTMLVERSVSGLHNPTYLCTQNDLIYAVEETDAQGSLVVLRRTAQGFQLLQRCPAGDPNSCHLDLDPAGSRIAVSNYASNRGRGSLTLYQLDDAGLVCGSDTMAHPGSGPHPIRQRTSHLHFARFLPQGLLACDLGLDRLHLYTLEQNRLASAETALVTPPGSGPRHFCLLPGRTDWLYLLCELDARVHVYHLENGHYCHKQVIDSLPAGTSGAARAANLAAAIKTDGSFVFVTNRGFDSVTAFSLTDSHLLQLEDICPTGSEEPRDLMILDQYLLMGHHTGRKITAMRWDALAKKLVPLPVSLTLPVAPVCLVRDH